MSDRLIDYYKAIETGSQKMLEAAMADDWDQVVRFESACAVLIEQLRERAQSLPLEAEHRGEKAQIMQRILNIDAQMRMLAEPWLQQADMQCIVHKAQSHLLH